MDCRSGCPEAARQFLRFFRRILPGAGRSRILWGQEAGGAMKDIWPGKGSRCICAGMERRENMARKPLTPIDLNSYKPLRELVFETVRKAIIAGELPPGERIMETQLAEELGVSRTPVREAIRKLELEGLVAMLPRKGAYVSGVSMKDIIEVFEIRSALEGLAASLAAERITDDELEELERQLVKTGELIDTADLEKMVETDSGFHQMLYKFSRNERLAQIINNLREQIHRSRQTS